MQKTENMEEEKDLTVKSDFFSMMLGIKITDASKGYARGELVVEKKHMNPIGTVHGGCLYAMADTVGGYAAASCGMPSPTLSGNMYFLRPTIGVKKLICEARVVKNGKRIRVVELVIRSDKGDEIAHSIFEYMDVQRQLAPEESRSELNKVYSHE